MRLAVDECCDAALVAGLREDGHDVWYVMESARGMGDLSLLQRAAAEQRVLITEDKDFGDLVIRLGLPAHGIVLVRIEPADSDAKLLRLREVLETHPHRLAGCLTVVDRSKTRFRPMHPP